MLNALNHSTMNSSNVIDLGYAIVDFDSESISWNFQGFSVKRDKAIRKAFKVFAIDVDYLRSI